MKTRHADDEVQRLLSALSLKLGFCLPLPLVKRIINNPPASVDRFTDVVYKGEGLDPDLKSPLYYQVHELVAKAFEQHLHQGDGQSV
jgi:hypothetical protein